MRGSSINAYEFKDCMRLSLVVHASVLVLLAGCPRKPDVFRCDDGTGADCDAGSPGLSGTWTLSVLVDQPFEVPGRKVLTEQATFLATIKSVGTLRVDGGWRLEIPGYLGVCCSPGPFIDDDLTLTPQSIPVRSGTPMTLTHAVPGPDGGVSVMSLEYESLGSWSIEVTEPSHGLETPSGIRFSRVPGRMQDRVAPDGGHDDDINYDYTIELKR